MDKNKVLNALKELKKDDKKRNFVQSYDLIITLKGLDLKKTEQKVDFFVTLHYNKGKKSKLGAFVGPELSDDAKKVFETVITPDDFPKFADKKIMKKLADEHDFFISQANIMGQVAGAFGRVLGPRGKMPNPKAGCVVPPKANLGPLYERLQSMVRISAKKFPVIQVKVGTEEMSDEDLAKNILYFYDQIVHHLPKERHNIRGALIKLSMTKPIKMS